jgi:hypothetical protein
MDLEAIKSRLNAMQKTTNGKGGGDRTSLFWKPTVGKQTVRVVPSKYNPIMPFSEIFFHYGIDKPVMVSPINWGDKDPIVEFAAQLKKTNDKENWKLSKKIEPKARYFAPVIVRGEEDKGVRLWQFGKEIYEAFLQMAVDEEVGDYTDVMEGRDIKLTTVGPEATGTPYNKTTISPSMKNSPLGDAEQVRLWKDNQPNPKELFKPFTFDEMKLALQNWLNPEATEGEIIDDEKEVEEAPKTNYSINTSNAAVKQSKLDKFDSLFDEDSTSDDLPF